MSKILYFIGSMGLGKLMPLLFGMLVASHYGPDAYALFVQMLVKSNFLTIVATVSYVQLILSSARPGNQEAPASTATRALVFSLQVSLAGAAWALYTGLPQGGCPPDGGCGNAATLALAVLAYSLGNAVLSTVVAQFNADNQTVRAGTAALLGLLLPYGGGFLAVGLGLDHHMALRLLAAAFLVGALGAYARHNRGFLRALGRADYLRLARQCYPLRAEQLYTLVFVGAILFSHSYVISAIARANGAHATAAFSLGYQLFSIAIFVPSVLGSVIVPRLSRKTGAAVPALKKIAVLYALVALAWAACVFVFRERLLRGYGLPVGAQEGAILLLLQVAGVFAALGALLNQGLIAARRHISLAALSLLYALILCGWARWTGFAALDAACGVAAAYAVVLLVGVVLLRRNAPPAVGDQAAGASKN